MFKKLIALLIAFSLLLSTFLFVNATDDSFVDIDSKNNTVEFEDSESDIFELSELREEKKYCTATIDDNFVDNVVVVVIDKYVGEINKAYTADFFGGSEDIESIEDLTYITGDPYELGIDIDSFHQILKITLKTHSKENVLNAIRNFEAIDGVKSAGPDYIFENPGVDIDTDFACINPLGYGEVVFASDDVVVPGDDCYSFQWGLGAINAPQAWNYTTGSQTIKVGVIDGGVDDLDDFEDNLVSGWDYYSTNAAIVPGTESYLGDWTGHGTPVAGIIGAQGDNGEGITGVCWDVSIVPFRTARSSTQAMKAVNRATNYNIPILNYSRGGYGSDENFADAIRNYPGLFVCSAGNDATDNDKYSHYPSNYQFDNIIAVAAAYINPSTNETELVPSGGWNPDSTQGSNYGVETVNIAAPGKDIYTLAAGGEIDEDFGGTSAAAPFVAGTAALVLSICPDMSTEQLKDIILDTASTEAALVGKVANGAFLDAGAAVEKAANMVKVTFNDNNGNTKVVYYEKGTTYGELPVPERDGCTFSAWYNGSTLITEDTVVTSGDKQFSAVWSANVNFSSTGTAVTHAPIEFELSGSLTITSDMVSERFSRKFVGWTVGSDGTVYRVGDTITGIVGDITLTAQWERVYALLTYDTRYFESMEPQQVFHVNADKEDGKYYINASILNSPSVGGYTFTGWQIKGGDGTIYVPGNDQRLPGFKSYYFEDAVLDRITGGITYNANGGEFNVESQSILLHETTVITREEPVRDGYTFLGWALSADGEAEYAPGAAYDGKQYVTFYANWESDSIVIRFDTGTEDDDSAQACGAPLSVKYNADTGIIIPDDIPSRPGYAFKGWEYSGSLYEGGDTLTLPASVTSSIDPNGENIVRLVAVWEANPESAMMVYVDEYKYGGRTNTSYKRVVTLGSTYGQAGYLGEGDDETIVPHLDDTTGYCFDGWYDAEGNIIDENTVVTKEGFHYAYAHWVPRTVYADVSSDYNRYVSLSHYYGYMNGTGTDDEGNNVFLPNDTVDRGTASIVLYRLEASPNCGNNHFWDIDTNLSNGSDNELSLAATWVSDNDIYDGATDYYFDATHDITREELAVMLYNYAVYKGIEDQEEISADCLSIFTDADEVSADALTAVKWAVTNGIMGGTSATTLSPKSTVNRLQLAIFAGRMRNELISNKVITSVEVTSDVNEEADSVGFVNCLLGDNSWAQINAASEAGVADVIWNVGDTKDVTLSTGATITMQIYGFEHDDLTAGGKAGITFGLKDTMRLTRSMANTNSNVDGFTGTAMYDWLNETLYEQLPDDVKCFIKNVDKKTSVGGESTEISTDSMGLFLFSEYECFGRLHYSVEGEGEQYEIFKGEGSANRIKVHNDLGIYEWWLRSPKATSSSSFCIVHSTGNAGYTSASWPYAGVNFGLCI